MFIYTTYICTYTRPCICPLSVNMSTPITRTCLDTRGSCEAAGAHGQANQLNWIWDPLLSSCGQLCGHLHHLLSCDSGGLHLLPEVAFAELGDSLELDIVWQLKPLPLCNDRK